MLEKLKNLNFKIKPSLNQVLAAIITLLSIAAIFVAFRTFHIDRYIEVLELKTYDLRAANRLFPSPNRPSNDIIILAFDDMSLNAYGDEYGTWPWPRYVHSDMIQFLNDVAHVKMIVYDLIFSTPQKFLSGSDEQLVETFDRYDNVVLSSNFDHQDNVMAEIGKYDSQELSHLEPSALKVQSHLKPTSQIKINDDHFFAGRNINFEHFRPLLPGLMAAEKNLAFVNHETDIDGISRANPLIYSLKTKAPIRSTALPINKISTDNNDTTTYTDQEGNLVNEFGYRLDQTGAIERKNYQGYFPYLSLKTYFKLHYNNSPPTIKISPNGYLSFDNKIIPLLPNGTMLINWYNVDFQKDLANQMINNIQQYISQLQQDKAISPEEKRKFISRAREDLSRHQRTIESPFKSIPYNMISAWEVLKARDHFNNGTLNNQDKQLLNYLKNKIIFAGATAVATYDTKYTPLHPLGTQGILIPVTIFDNLRQDNHLMHRLDANFNLLITVALCLICAFTAVRLRSATAGMLTIFALCMLYAIVATIIFKQMNLWINLAMPLIAVLITALLTFMMKYISRDQDYEKTYIMATTDSMTGLYNHRFFQEHMLNSIQRSDRFNQKFSLVLIDIDFFKKFNDTYGHQAGDEVLRCVARKLKDCVRTIDVVARYGGEEMAVILDRANEEEALAVAEKLVKEIAAEAYPISEGVKKHVTISVGVATYPTHGKTTNELIEFSDQGLYRAKENGRNQVGAQYDTDRPKEEKNEHQKNDK